MTPQNSPFYQEPSRDIAVLEHRLTPDQREEFMAGLAKYCRAYGVKVVEFYPEEFGQSCGIRGDEPRQANAHQAESRQTPDAHCGNVRYADARRHNEGIASFPVAQTHLRPCPEQRVQNASEQRGNVGRNSSLISETRGGHEDGYAPTAGLIARKASQQPESRPASLASTFERVGNPGLKELRPECADRANNTHNSGNRPAALTNSPPAPRRTDEAVDSDSTPERVHAPRVGEVEV